MIFPLIKFINSQVQSLFRRIHRAIDPVGQARKIGVKIGDRCRLISVEFGEEPFLISIGNHVSITKATFITHDGGVWIFRDELPDLDLFKPITIGNNVFIGYGTVILPGAVVSDNVVIGAMSVVSGFIPPDSICAGVPAKKIRTFAEYKERAIEIGIPTKNTPAQKKQNHVKQALLEKGLLKL
jgi:acetyltransferase-like isoleucine patch superfamily enzyme